VRVQRLFLLILGSLFLSSSLSGQQSSPTVQSDPTAIALIQKSVAAMAINVPSDSSATGNITVVEGSMTDSGSISVQTLGTGETSETLNLSGGQRAVIYSNGDAKETNGTQSVNPVVELIVTDQCADFPLPLLLGALNNTDEAFQYVGLETLNGASVQHIKFWSTFSSKPRMQKLASFSTRDVWLDAASSLPVKIAYMRQPGEGAVHSTRMEIFLSNYTNVNGVQYPFQISKSYNGTLWQTITIQSVSFNTGLTDSQFQTE
jgi:hypothetical protein